MLYDRLIRNRLHLPIPRLRTSGHIRGCIIGRVICNDDSIVIGISVADYSKLSLGRFSSADFNFVGSVVLACDIEWFGPER